MACVILGLIAVVCAFGWLQQYVATAAIIRWILKKEIPFSADQLKDDLSYVWRKVLKIN